MGALSAHLYQLRIAKCSFNSCFYFAIVHFLRWNACSTVDFPVDSCSHTHSAICKYQYCLSFWIVNISVRMKYFFFSIAIALQRNWHILSSINRSWVQYVQARTRIDTTKYAILLLKISDIKFQFHRILRRLLKNTTPPCHLSSCPVSALHWELQPISVLWSSNSPTLPLAIKRFTPYLYYLLLI